MLSIWGSKVSYSYLKLTFIACVPYSSSTYYYHIIKYYYYLIIPNRVVSTLRHHRDMFNPLAVLQSWALNQESSSLVSFYWDVFLVWCLNSIRTA